MWTHRDPSQRKNPGSNVFVKNLDKKIDNKALFETFQLFGDILSCKIATDDNGRSLGYGFVHYADNESAKQAIERVNNMQIGEKTVFVGPFMARGERPEGDGPVIYTNLYVKNFPDDYEETDIKSLFSTFGTITSACVNADAKGRKSAFVCYEKPEMARAAVEDLNGKDLRTDEQKKAYEEAKKNAEEEKLPEPEEGLLFVGRAQTKRERVKALKQEFASTTAPGAEKSVPEHPGLNLYVKNLDDGIDDVGLKQLFEKYGEIGSAHVMCDESGRSRGFGFISIMDKTQGQEAINDLHLKIVSGKPLYVGLAEKRGERQQRLNARFRQQGNGYGGPNGGMNGGFNNNGPMYYSGQGGNNNMRPNMMMNNMMQQPMPGQWGNPGMRPNMMMGPQGGMRPNMMGGPPYGGMNPMQMNQGMMRPNMNQNMRPNMMGGNMPKQFQGGPRPGGMPAQGGYPQGGPNFTSTARNQNMMPQQNMMRPPMQQAPAAAPQNAERSFNPNQPLTAAALAAAPPGMQKQMLGEKLFPAVARWQPELAGKITGMMLEMDNSELLILLESDTQMKAKVDEALRVLDSQKEGGPIGRL